MYMHMHNLYIKYAKAYIVNWVNIQYTSYHPKLCRFVLHNLAATEHLPLLHAEASLFIAS